MVFFWNHPRISIDIQCTAGENLMWGSETVQFDHSDLTRLTLSSQSATLFFWDRRCPSTSSNKVLFQAPLFCAGGFNSWRILLTGGSGNNGWVHNQQLNMCWLNLHVCWLNYAGYSPYLCCWILGNSTNWDVHPNNASWLTHIYIYIIYVCTYLSLSLYIYI